MLVLPFPPVHRHRHAATPAKPSRPAKRSAASPIATFKHTIAHLLVGDEPDIIQ
jgi:hypothetical protein